MTTNTQLTGYEGFDQAVLENIPRLAKLGFTDYTREEIVAKGARAGEIDCKYLFRSVSSPRMIKFSAARNVTLCQMSVFRDERTLLPMPIGDTVKGRSSFGLDEYFLKLKRTDLDDLNSTRKSTSAGPGAIEYYRKYISICLDVIESDLLDVVQGKRWEIVPVDWMGYK